MSAALKWNLIVDVAQCHNCNNCVLAARDELVGNAFAGYSAPHPSQGRGTIRIERRVRGRGHQVDCAYLPQLCNHCDAAPCVEAGGGAVVKRADGIVLFDPLACRGRRDLVDACPYGAVVWNEERLLPQTWFFDAHLLDAGWREPRAVTACPTQALQAVRATDAEMAERAQREGLRVLKPELGTQPRVHYRNLRRFDRGFVAVSISATGKGVVSAPGEGVVSAGGECVEGAAVELLHEGRLLAQASTDAFGDVRFGGLEPGRYTLKVTHPAGCAQRDVTLGDDAVVLDDITLGA
jgi:Fe-S-cluster-containing dehydrogenase component